MVDALVDDDGGTAEKERERLFYKIPSSLSVEGPEADGGYLLIVGYKVAAGDEDGVEESGSNEPYKWGMQEQEDDLDCGTDDGTTDLSLDDILVPDNRGEVVADDTESLHNHAERVERYHPFGEGVRLEYPRCSDDKHHGDGGKDEFEREGRTEDGVALGRWDAFLIALSFALGFLAYLDIV